MERILSPSVEGFWGLVILKDTLLIVYPSTTF